MILNYLRFEKVLVLYTPMFENLFFLLCTQNISLKTFKIFIIMVIIKMST